MKIERIAAFCDGDRGGNPAGVVIGDVHPDASEMQRIAADVGYSETAFAMPVGDAWRVRYFAPEIEVPFCGHATIALGAALAFRFGNGIRKLLLNDAEISVEGFAGAESMSATLRSPPTSSRRAPGVLVAEALHVFSYEHDDLDPRLPPAIANAGNNQHLVLALNSRDALSRMSYDLETGKKFMTRTNIVTVSLIFAESAALFHARNPFASGGVYEDPATGSAAAALGGYLSTLAGNTPERIEILQGADMGCPSRIHVELPRGDDHSARVGGRARFIQT